MYIEIMLTRFFATILITIFGLTEVFPVPAEEHRILIERLAPRSHLDEVMAELQAKERSKKWRSHLLHEVNNIIGRVNIFATVTGGRLDKDHPDIWPKFRQILEKRRSTEFTEFGFSNCYDYFNWLAGGLYDHQMKYRESLDPRDAKKLKDFLAMMSQDFESFFILLPTDIREDKTLKRAASSLRFETVMDIHDFFSDLASMLDEGIKGELSTEKENVSLDELVWKIINQETRGYSRFGKPRKINDLEKIQTRLLPRHLRQVLTNLIKNANEAAQAISLDRPLEIAVSLKTGDHPREAVLEVADNGPGMHEVIRAKAFELGVTSKGRDRGIGLYLSRLMVENWGGKISVKSELGKGTTFRITFPVLKPKRSSSKKKIYVPPLEIRRPSTWLDIAA